MNSEDLKRYKQKLSTLDDSQRKQRELHLRKISNGDIMGPMVGYPTIDKPWLKYMTEENVVKDIPVKNVYQELFDNNKDYPDQIALMYFGAKISFRSFFKNIDKAAKALYANGVRKGTFVTVYAITTPEIIYAFYACARLGAICSFMNPFELKGTVESKKGTAEIIRSNKSKLAIVLDKFYSSSRNILEDANIEKIVLLPTLNSSPLRFISKGTKPEKDNEILWNKFIKEGRNIELPKEIPFEDEMPLVTVCSSGSTGKPKAIVLTHDSLENSAHAYPRCEVPTKRASICYQVVPAFASTGISTSVHMPLSQGGTLFMDPRFERKVFVKNNLKMNPSATVASTSLFQGFLDESLLPPKGNLSNFTACFQGGEKVEMEDKLAIEAVFKRYNSNAKLMNGYGQCECGAGIATQTALTPSNCSVGIPIPGVTVGLFDENRNEQRFNKRGEILVNTPCGMKEYFNNPEATAQYFYYDELGTKWNCTGDMGVMNENGEITVLGRMSDCSIVNGKKFYNFDIENVIRKFDFVQNCDVFCDNNNTLVGHIILKERTSKEKYREIIDTFTNALLNEFHDNDYLPQKYKFRDSFPASIYSKRDVAAMKAETDGFIMAG